MRTEKVLVGSYNYKWKIEFEKLKVYFQNMLNDNIISIEHIGSTSVEGLSAKPIIDIDIVIKDYSKFEKVKSILRKYDYFHEGDLGIKDREAFRYNESRGFMTHHLYVCPENSLELKRHIAFRNYLKFNKDYVARYSKIKIEAAKLYPNDIDKYIAYKWNFIKDIYNKIDLINKK